MAFLRWPFWVWPLSLVGVILGLNGATWLPQFTTSDPVFCLSCHAAGDTRNVGQASAIHPPYQAVGCTQCHAKSGQWPITDIYRNGVSADPKRVSENCLRCHKDAAKKDESNFKYNVINIRIPHQLHVEGVGATCATCHRNIAHDFTPTPTNRPRMDYCFQCHDQKRDSCLKCHAQGLPQPTAPPKEVASPSSSTKPDGASLYSQSCALCHGPKGNALSSANLASKEFLSSRGEDSLLNAVARGTGAMPGYGKMAGGPLSEEQIAAIIAWLRSQAQ
ncbi:MAG: c-type cytochrome [Chloroflexi bacterium]|nr:c-type cytochrome [Chloroflexota bacterium]